MLNPTYPQTPLRTDIATLLQQSNGRGQDELTKLKEVIRNGYLEIQALSAQNILESGVVSDKIRTYFPNLITTASNIHLRDHPLFDQLGTLVDQRNMHWKYNHAAAEPRFLDSHVDLSLPNEVAYDLHPPLEASYNSFLKIAVLTQTLQWNSESLVIMGQEMERIFQDDNSRQEADHFTTIDYYWYNALINATFP